MSRFTPVLLLAALALTTGCGNIHRQMMHSAISEFAKPVKKEAPERIWVTPPADQCSEGSASGVAKRGFFKRFLKGGGGGAHRLAQEVFTNYLTAERRGKIIEPHRSNYFTGQEVKTRMKVTREVNEDKEKNIHAVVGTFEDPCILDEAKKRSADKVLTYKVLRLKKDELEIHLRLSDVKKAVVEHSRTLLVEGSKVSDSPTR